MTRRRWIADEVDGDSAALTGDNAKHLAQVLRAQVGRTFDVVADGRVRAGTVTRVGQERVEFALGEEIEASADSPNVTLLLAIFKFDRMEWAIEKVTELGVAEILPVIARRTDAHLASSSVKRAERWRKIAKEAAQQSRRVHVPEIAEPERVKSAVEKLSTAKNRIVLSEMEKAVSLTAALAGITASDGIVLAVGPEGGWAMEELQLFAENGWKSASLGPTILRAETAAIAAIAVATAFSS